MRILHTADWHLNDRLGRIDRTDDLRKGVERVAAHCREQKVDVLLVAGDLFSELARPDALRETIRHWQDVFADFLNGGGTILTLTGNHDNENFCQTLRHAMTLAAPAGRHGLVHSPGYWIATAILALSCVCQCLTRRDPEALLAPIGYCVGCLAIIAAPAAAAIGCALAVTSLFAFRRLNAFFGVAIVTLPVLDYVLGGSLPWLLPGLIVLTLPLFLTLVTGRTLEIPTRGNPRGVDTGLPHR